MDAHERIVADFLHDLRDACRRAGVGERAARELAVRTGAGLPRRDRVATLVTALRADALTRGLDPAIVGDLDHWLGRHEAARVRLAALVDTPGAQDRWWVEYADVVADHDTAQLSAEGRADDIRVYARHTVPVVLRTDEYAAALLGDRPDLDRRLALLHARRRLLQRDGGPSLRVVVNEGALRDPVPASARRAQLERLLDPGDNVTVQVVARRSSAHEATVGPVMLYGFDGDRPGMVYLEQAGGALYPRGAEHLAYYRRLWDGLATHALCPASSRAYLHAMLEATPDAEPPDAAEGAGPGGGGRRLAGTAASA